MNPKKTVVIREETRSRCTIVPYDEKMRKRFAPIGLELFHYLYEVPAINFSIFIRVEDEMIEFVKPEELSNELLQQVTRAMMSESGDVEIFVLAVDHPKFQQAIDSVRQKKMNALLEKDPDLDRKVADVFINLSSASQMVVRGGLTDATAQRVKGAATFAVNNLLDSEIAIGTLSRMVLADPTLYDHSASVAMMAGVIAKKLLAKPLGQKDCETVARCALYHDVGKTCVPNHILNKPGKFTEEEFAVMKSHTTLGYEEMMRSIKNGINIEEVSARVTLEHHEKFCGGGYPHNRKGRFEEDSAEGIHLFTRIVTIADVYSALLMKRIYKPAYAAQDAIKIMAGCAKDYDPAIFTPFVKSVVLSLNTFEEQKKKSKGRILTFDESGQLQEKSAETAKSGPQK